MRLRIRSGEVIAGRHQLRTATPAAPIVLALALLATASGPAHAQRSSEDAVAQAEDAFGLTVGREAIGLYSDNSARGFSPEQAGNLRIDGLYYDEVTNQPALPDHVVRSSAVHVGIAAQGYLFAAPTGVVDYQLRIPGDRAVLSTLNGFGSYGQLYDETDFSLPIVSDSLSIGGGVGYSRNSSYFIAHRSDDWTAGWLARWQPTSSLVITPFWGMTHHVEFGERPFVVLDESGIPRFRGASLGVQPWTDWSLLRQDFGATAHMLLDHGWQMAAGIFRSLSYSPINYSPLLLGVGSLNEGEYELSAFPEVSSGSTSGELRLTRLFGTGALRNTVYLRLTGRKSSIESGGAAVSDIGPGTTTYAPYARPDFVFSPTTDVRTSQWTPGVAYRGAWRDVAQLSLGVQKVYYERTVATGASPTISYSTSPLLFSATASGQLTRDLLVYGSYTRGFENIGNAPVNASNANEPVPSQLTWQVDAGLRYQIQPKLQLVAGVFEIGKPYFNLDQSYLFRLLGKTTNRGAEFSLTGDLTSRLNVVSGLVFIQPKVQYIPGAVSGRSTVVAVGPIPAYLSTDFQYHSDRLPGLILGTSIQLFSSRYAVYPTINLPSVITVGADVRYRSKVFDHDATYLLQMFNLSDAYTLAPSASGVVGAMEARRFEFSLVVDI